MLVRPVMNSLLLASAAILASSPVVGQDTETTIVVTGDRDEKKIIHDYIASIVSEAPRGQYASFQAPICPSVIGFEEETATFIKQRMLAVAEAGNVQTDKEGCSPNLHLVIVDDGKETLETLGQDPNGAFFGLRPSRIDQISNSGGPVYNWHLVKERSTHSNENRNELGAGGTGVVGTTYSLITSEGINAGMAYGNSRITRPVYQSISHSFVVIERDAVLGLSPVQIADHAIMRGLIMTKSDENSGVIVDSILGLFDTDSPFETPPEALTLWDLALLKSLYAARGNVPSRTQRGDMTRTFQKVVAAGE